MPWGALPPRAHYTTNAELAGAEKINLSYVGRVLQTDPKAFGSGPEG